MAFLFDVIELTAFAVAPKVVDVLSTPSYNWTTPAALVEAVGTLVNLAHGTEPALKVPIVVIFDEPVQLFKLISL